MSRHTKAKAISKSSGSVIVIDMAKLGQEQPIDVGTINMSIPDTLIGGVYANTIAISVTNTEVILDFAFVSSPDKGVVVSRIVIPPIFVNNIANSLNQVIEAQKKAKYLTYNFSSYILSGSTAPEQSTQIGCSFLLS